MPVKSRFLFPTPISAMSINHSAVNFVMVLSKVYFVSDQINRYTLMILADSPIQSSIDLYFAALSIMWSFEKT